ncbi:MAG TPA: L,D-transpeptidase family protein [Actinomycetota bacterium]|nr:L,D-transpeptidase family protein [Actinomycetota bacterium]
MKRVAGLLLVATVVLLVPTVASAQTVGTITLSASSRTITFGEHVRLSGTSAGAPPGSIVQIRNAADLLVASVTTDAGGDFSAQFRPAASDSYVAVLGGDMSGPVTVGVRAVVSARMGPVRLFDHVVVRGTVDPARPGSAVVVELSKDGRTVETGTVKMGAAGGFRARFTVPKPGTYRARASFSAPDLLRDVAWTPADATPLPRLSSGSSGRFVRLLEGRLVDLDYRLVGTKDGRFDSRTADAVIAFHKVQRMDRTGSVSVATWRRLATPIRPHARRAWQGFHFEVDQTRQVLYTVEDGEITNVLHVSTGAGGLTRDGSFQVRAKIAGFSPNRLYYPSYFDGYRALHGWPEVPTYAASHGCVRIPYWNAKWVYGLADYGTPVVIYH